MNSRGIQARNQDFPAKRLPFVNSVRSAKPATGEIAKLSRFQTPKPQPKNGDTAFDPEGFLARTGLGKKIVRLKKDQMAYAQGDPADTIFYVQKGRLRVTVTSANGKRSDDHAWWATENSWGRTAWSQPHPIRLATATAMTDCALAQD